jgi:phosphate transport system substrate-binding protein
MLLSSAITLTNFKGFADEVTITGAGATFPAPLYMKWANEANKELGIKVNYQSIGSGAGINQIRNRTVTFGATDAPLDNPDDIYQFPTVEGSVVLIYNLPEVPDLFLTMDVINKIYSGKIEMWNHPEIAALNPKANLPRIATKIAPIYRAEGSGTTFIWTNAMKKAGNWNDTGTSIKWPTGQGAKGNDGIASVVQRIRGSIGYVEYIYAKNNNIPISKMDVEVTGRTYILLPKNPKEKTSQKATIDFFTWCFTKGLDIAVDMGYKPLPKTEYQQIINDLRNM